MKYANYDKTTGKILGWYDQSIHSEIPTPKAEVEDEVWQNAIKNNHNKINEDGTTELFDFRTQEEIDAQNLATFKKEVQTAIDKTDLVALRCWKAGVEFPTEWKEYTLTLRTLLASTVVVELPVMPDYPVGS